MKKSVLIALVITAVSVIWVLSGVLGGNSADGAISDEAAQTDTSDIERAVEVRVQDLTAQPMEDTVTVTGRTQASRRVNLRAEIEGQVIKILTDKGTIVKKGQVLAKLGLQDRAARVLEAEQLLNQRKIQYNAAEELTEKGFNSRVRLAEARAELEGARAQLKQARVTLSNTNIKAPFDAVINGQTVEVGDYVSKGDIMFDLVDLDPMEISGFLTEKQMEYVTEGTNAVAELLRGKEVTGEITFIAAAANQDTRTFEMEMTLPNPDHKIKEGLTAKILIPIREAKAYKISPSILSLSDDGAIGIKIVDADDKVEFMPIRLLKDTPDYLWIGGLPDQVRVITVGQEFVVSGQKVTPILAEGQPSL